MPKQPTFMSPPGGWEALLYVDLSIFVEQDLFATLTLTPLAHPKLLKTDVSLATELVRYVVSVEHFHQA